MNSSATGMIPEEMIASTHAPAISLDAERRQHRAGAFRAAQDAHGHFGDDRQLALAAGEQTQPVIPGGVQMRRRRSR